MIKFFKKFLENIELTSFQKEDAKTKYNGVCKTIHTFFYETDYDGTTKFLFGSYKKKTNIRPIIKEQDVDVLVKLPYEIYQQYDAYQGNGQSELLRKIKYVLSDTYSTTDNIKGWGKVVLVEFSDGTHNVELLPAFENDDGSFTIPNSSNGGSWEIFNPRSEIDAFLKSDSKSNGLTRELSRMIKKWAREVHSLSIKSYLLEEYIVDFLDEHSYENIDYPLIIRDFFEYLTGMIDESNKSYTQTALNRANKAIEYALGEKYESAVEEWRKIFGKEFPSYSSIYNESEKTLAAPSEQFIEDVVTIDTSQGYRLKIDCWTELPGFRHNWLSFFIKNSTPLNKKKSLEFKIVECSVPEPFVLKWKVRNFGKEAEEKNQLRGEIVNDDGNRIKKESTSYQGEHYVECYAIKNNVCVARSKIKVPIN